MIDVRDLKVHFATGRGRQPVRAIDGFSLSVRAGESHAVVGESGCGKTTMARTILGLQGATGGEIRIHGRELSEWMNDRKALAREVQFVFQNPLGALSRRQTVGQSLEEPLLIHHVGNRRMRETRFAISSIWSACRRRSSTGCQEPCPVASASAWPSRARSRSTPGS